MDLANFLNSMGADIMGAGTDVIKVKGVSQLHGTEYSVIPDQIEAGTFMVAAAATCGDITLKNVIPKHLEPITAKLRKIGVYVEIEDDTDNVRVVGRPHYEGTDIKTSPHPGFPTDMQPQMTTLLAMSNGTSTVSYTHLFPRKGAILLGLPPLDPVGGFAPATPFLIFTRGFSTAWRNSRTSCFFSFLPLHFHIGYATINQK